jgi:hypothetical protein
MNTDRPDARPVLHCTCETGTCARTGHVPMLAACGHPGIYRHIAGRSVCMRPTCHDVAMFLCRPFPTQEAIGRAIGALTGVSGRPGGWVYGTDGKPICQGWASYAHTFVGQRSGGVSTIEYRKGRGYLVGEVGLRRVAAHLERLRERTSA